MAEARQGAAHKSAASSGRRRGPADLEEMARRLEARKTQLMAQMGGKPAHQSTARSGVVAATGRPVLSHSV